MYETSGSFGAEDWHVRGLQAYSVLSSPGQRQSYNARLQAQLQDDLDDYTGNSVHCFAPYSCG